MKKIKYNIEIEELYKDYECLIDFKLVINRLLSGIPVDYLAGLKKVKLNNVDILNHKERKKTTRAQGKKYRLIDCNGWYNQFWNGEPASIQILVDNVVEKIPTILLRFPLIQDMVFAMVFFHELGHHIHQTQVREYKEKELVAEEWSKKLNKYYFQRKYWYLLPAMYIAYYIVLLLIKIRDSIRK